MDRKSFKNSKALTVNASDYDDIAAAIEEAIASFDNSDKVENVQKFGKAAKAMQASQRSIAKKQLAILMMEAGTLCEYGNPPAKKIDPYKRPGRPIFFKCRHSPPHYFDKDGNDIQRP